MLLKYNVNGRIRHIFILLTTRCVSPQNMSDNGNSLQISKTEKERRIVFRSSNQPINALVLID